MSSNPGSEGKRTALAAAGFLLLSVLCCGLPVLVTAGALGALGSALGNPWVIGAAIVVVAAGMVCCCGATRARPGSYASPARLMASTIVGGRRRRRWPVVPGRG